MAHLQQDHLQRLDSSSHSSSDGKTEKVDQRLADFKLATTQREAQPHKRDLWADFKKRDGEGVLHYIKRLGSEGHSVPDAFLTVAASQIGQIMLTCPNALWKSGLISGGIFAGLTCFFSLFTMYLMNVMYMDRKRKLIADGTWGKASQKATQYHTVLGFHMGKTMRWIAQIIILLQLMGTGVAQIIACAADWYSIEKGMTKRELQLVWGGILTLMVLIPEFRHLRVLNILALVGTTFTAFFLNASAAIQGYGEISAARLWPEPTATASGAQMFFTGAAVLMNALGGHAIAMEMMDAMETPAQYTAAYTGGWVWTIFLVVPHSIAINLAFPKEIGGSDNVYGVIPMSKSKVASVSLMILHQLAAYTYYVTPVVFMWEKLIHTHRTKWYIRLPSRLPVSLFLWLLAMMFPFYGAINSLMSSISTPFTAFVLPCIVFMWLHRTPELREQSIMPPFKWLRAASWKPMFALCILAIVVYGGFGFAAIAYSIKTIVDQSKSFGIFARCYQCAANYEQLLRNPGNNL